MRRKLLDVLCCPVCKSGLVLAVVREDETEIHEGKLTCTKCCVDYPIREGIPDLLPRHGEGTAGGRD
ncbi:MAG: methytransferase partner Trm112 [Methanomicrobiales archaeon]|nr:methytransferase partner Trm112 [Methanomicrobiales archaeon]